MRAPVCAIVAAIGLAAHPAFAQADRAAPTFWKTVQAACDANIHAIGVDVSARALGTAARKLRLDRMPDSQRERLTLLQSSVTYRDIRLAGLDAVVLMEVIEHLDPPRLPALERAVFGDANQATIIVTTPNVEHNVRYESLPAGAFRHRDHRFEWRSGDRSGRRHQRRRRSPHRRGPHRRVRDRRRVGP